MQLFYDAQGPPVAISQLWKGVGGGENSDHYSALPMAWCCFFSTHGISHNAQTQLPRRLMDALPGLRLISLLSITVTCYQSWATLSGKEAP